MVVVVEPPPGYRMVVVVEPSSGYWWEPVMIPPPEGLAAPAIAATGVNVRHVVAIRLSFIECFIFFINPHIG
jgi:hypothetical protein